jgi:hypothetical protein
MSSTEQITDYGFEWGPMEVTRLTEYRGSCVLGIRAGKNHLQVCVSPKGQSIRVWLNGTPMVEFGDDA